MENGMQGKTLKARMAILDRVLELLADDCALLDTRHLWNIARFTVRAIKRELVFIDEFYDGEFYQDDMATVYRRRTNLSMAIDELDYRGVLPTQDDLCVARDRACAAGAVTDTHAPRCFVELWVAFRGESTATPEYLASLKEAA